MPKRGKNYKASAELYNKQELHDVDQALDIVLKTAKAKFDETVEAHFKMGLDGRHADQQIRGAVVLPHGTGNTKRVLVFAKGPKATEAEEVGRKGQGREDSGRLPVDELSELAGKRQTRTSGSCHMADATTIRQTKGGHRQWESGLSWKNG